MTEPARLALPEGMPVLTDEELASLPQELQDQYLAAVAAELQEVKLTEPQLRAHELGLKVDEVCYGGAAGGGKSHLAIWHADWCSRQFPMHRSLCLRSTMPELRRTLMAKAFELIDTDAAPGVVWRAADKEYRYGNGSVIEFGYCETMDDTRQFLSAEYDLIIIDESTDLGHEQIEMLRSRLRTTKHKRELGVNPHLMLLTNPGGVSHTWHKERFVDQTAAGEYVAVIDDRDALGRGKDRQVAFIPAKVGDNPFIDPDYVSNLVAISDPVRRAQYLDGDWDVFSDQYFSEFNRDIHVVDPFPIPPEWPRYGGYDWGYGAPAALLLAAVDNDRVVHVFREMYGAGMTAAAQAKEFRAWGEKVDFIAADPSIWRNTGVGVPISSQLLEAGLSPLRRAANERVDGWNRVREYLAVDPILGRPRVVIHSNCENLIRTLPLMRRDKNKPEDLNTRSDDHAVDAFRYLLMTRPRVPRSVQQEPSNYDERVQAYIHRKAGTKRRLVHDVLGRI